jgi:hypothetical protein
MPEEPAMHDNPQETAGSVSPFESGAWPGPGAAPRPDDFSNVPAEVVVRLMGLIDEAEGLFGDPVKAWAAIKIMIDDRKARHESRRSSEEPIPAEVLRREPRPFLGFDREKATYERIKPAMLETAEGKWITIVGEEVIGPFDDIADAERAGYRRFGPGPMYIRQVLTQEPPPLVLPPHLDFPCPT